jgi:hypothetical protein
MQKLNSVEKYYLLLYIIYHYIWSSKQLWGKGKIILYNNISYKIHMHCIIVLCDTVTLNN